MILRFFTHHPWMKLFSILFAISLWLIIRGEKHREMSVNIPVRFENLSSGMQITNSTPTMIRLKLRGSKMRMAKLDDTFFAPYVIDLEAAKLGDNAFGIYAEDFKVPFGVIIDRILPQRIHVYLSKSSQVLQGPENAGIKPNK